MNVLPFLMLWTKHQGISNFNDYSEWEIILENLHNLQVDVACLTEINLDVMMPEVKYTMLEKAKKWIRM